MLPSCCLSTSPAQHLLLNCCSLRPQVRRPGVLESVCLDLHLMRGVALQLRSFPEVRRGWGGMLHDRRVGISKPTMAGALQKRPLHSFCSLLLCAVPACKHYASSWGCPFEPTADAGAILRPLQVRSDWVAIIDAWASRFLDEMNYELEAANTRQFQRGEPERAGSGPAGSRAPAAAAVLVAGEAGSSGLHAASTLQWIFLWVRAAGTITLHVRCASVPRPPQTWPASPVWWCPTSSPRAAPRMCWC